MASRVIRAARKAPFAVGVSTWYGMVERSKEAGSSTPSLSYDDGSGEVTDLTGAPMTIDERLDKLTERHEALTQSIDLLHLDTQQNTKNIGTLALVVHELAKTVQDSKATIDTLGRIAAMHENRLDSLEGRSEPCRANSTISGVSSVAWNWCLLGVQGSEPR